MGRRLRTAASRHKSAMAAAQVRTAELEKLASGSATRKLGRAVVNSVGDDLDRIVASAGPDLKVDVVLEGVAMTRAGLLK